MGKGILRQDNPAWSTLKNQEEQGIGGQVVPEFALPSCPGFGRVIVELKSVRRDVLAHEIQLVHCGG